MRPISSEGRHRQGQMKLPNIQNMIFHIHSHKEKWSCVFGLSPKSSQSDSLLLEHTFAKKSFKEIRSKYEPIWFCLLGCLSKSILHSYSHWSKWSSGTGNTKGQQLNRHQQPQQGRPVKCNVIKERLAACLFICHNRRLVSRLIIHRRAIITPTSNHPHRALESFKGISAQFLTVFLENTSHA